MQTAVGSALPLLGTFQPLYSYTRPEEMGMVAFRCWHMPDSCYALQLPMSRYAGAHSSPWQAPKVGQMFLNCSLAAQPR